MYGPAPFFAGVDDYSLASTGCEWIAENYRDKGAQVALITGAAGTDPTNKTIQAFQDATKDTDINYAGDFAGDFDSAKAMSITEDLMTKYPELSVIYRQDHVMALGAASAVQDAAKRSKSRLSARAAYRITCNMSRMVPSPAWVRTSVSVRRICNEAAFRLL